MQFRSTLTLFFLSLLLRKRVSTGVVGGVVLISSVVRAVSQLIDRAC